MCLGVPGKIISIEDKGPLARSGQVSFGGISREVNLSLVSEAQVGDFVIVHAGFGISQVDENEAREIFEYLKSMGDLEGLIEK